MTSLSAYTYPAMPLLVTAQSLASETKAYPRMVRRVMALALKLFCGQLDIHMPDGKALRFIGREPGTHALMRVHHLNFAKRFLKHGDVGIAESYMAGEWDTPDLPAFLALFAENRDAFGVFLQKRPLTRSLQLIWHWLNRNTKRGAKRNIHAHYDLGNQFYESWLDPSMTYSSALFAEPGTSLSDAQHAKYQALMTKGQFAPGHHVLEIGCGWGGFAEYAAKTLGCNVTALTISQSQHDFAKKRIFDAGLAEKVTIKLQDYRDERGQYDRIASIEMLEAVGEAYWPVYFNQLRERLKPQGIAGIQVITIDEKIYPFYKKELDFIRAYVFPGGMLPTAQILRGLGTKFGLTLHTEFAFAEDYAKTLALWRERFGLAWPNVKPLGFDERFKRLWDYYLSYCEAGFRTKRVDVRQMFFARG